MMTTPVRTWICYAGMLLAFLLAPILIYLATDTRPDFESAYRHYKVAFALGAAVIVGWEIKQRIGSRARLVPLLGGILVVMATYSVVWRFIDPHFDYRAYRKAGRAIGAQTNLYVTQDQPYLYPPLLAESIYLLEKGLDAIEELVDRKAREHATDTVDRRTIVRPRREQHRPMFRLWCGLQVLAALAAYALGYKLARRLGADEILATGLPLGLLLTNHAFWRNLENGQVNLFVTVAIFIAILGAARRPFASGLAVALGAHLKTYPAFLLVAWTASGRWRVAAAAVFFFALIFAIQSAIFGTTVWAQYFEFAIPPPQQVKPESLATIGIISTIFGDGRAIDFTKTPWSLAAWLAAAAYTAVFLLMGWRFSVREWLWRHSDQRRDDGAVTSTEDGFRIMGHAGDAVVLPLLISPIVWNHQYLVLLPVLIWSVLILGSSRLRNWLPVVLLLAPHLGHPFHYVYYLGLWLWLYQTSPRTVWNSMRQHSADLSMSRSDGSGHARAISA